jgi:hypothetical protein
MFEKKSFQINETTQLMAQGIVNFIINKYAGARDVPLNYITNNYETASFRYTETWNVLFSMAKNL